MGNVLKNVQLQVNGTIAYQKMDGFGVNINAKYWANGDLKPVMNLLLHDLGATLFRVDIYGKSNWVDPTGVIGPEALCAAQYEKVYCEPVFQNGWGMIRYLNEQGIEPYITCSGDVPTWMLADDGKTLGDHAPFCDMLVSLLLWARDREGLAFKHFGPLNETDLGSPEGPTLSPDAYAELLELLVEKFVENNLDKVKLVVAEQAHFNADYIRAILKHECLADNIGAFGLHTYSDLTADRYQEVTEVLRNTPFADHSLWLSEFGDLDQTGEKEWYIAWKSFERLLDTVQAGFHGGMVWDAFDNYHDHDGAWTIYGLLRSARNIYTRKKRYYALKQIYRFVPPGFERVDIVTDEPGMKCLAFANKERAEYAIIGMNNSSTDAYVSAQIKGFSSCIQAQPFSYYRTSEHENCVKVEQGDFRSRIAANTYDGIEILVPAFSLFTITNVD